MDLNQSASNATNVSIGAGTLTTGLTVTEKYTDFVTVNAIAIGLACTVISLVVAITFHLINMRINKNRNKLSLAIQISKWEDEGKTQDEINRFIKMSGMK